MLVTSWWYNTCRPTVLIANSWKSEFCISQDSYIMGVVKQLSFYFLGKGIFSLLWLFEIFVLRLSMTWSRDGWLWGVQLYFDNWESDKSLFMEIIFIILISYSMQGTSLKILVNTFVTKLQIQRMLMTDLHGQE